VYRNFRQILDKIKGRKPCVVSVAVAQDDVVLDALKRAYDLGFVKAVLVGDAGRIAPMLKTAGLPQDIPIVHEPDTQKAAEKAVALVRQGEAQVLMKGLVNTAVFMKAVLSSRNGLRSGKLLNTLVAFEIPGEDTLLFLTDPGLNTYPSLTEKKDILTNSIQFLQRIDIPHPNVALLASNEVVSPKLPATVDARSLVEMASKGVFPPATIEGPLALDVIARKEAASHKGIESRVAGKTDLILVPDIETGNAVVKALTSYAKATAAAIVVGATHPIVMTSRSETPEGKLCALALAQLAYTEQG